MNGILDGISSAKLSGSPLINRVFRAFDANKFVNVRVFASFS